MIQQIFAVYDEKAAAYLNPFFLPTDGMAIRAISDLLQEATQQFAQHPEDYTLYRIGIYDDSDASIIPKKELLTTMLELKAQSSNIVDIKSGEKQ